MSRWVVVGAGAIGGGLGGALARTGQDVHLVARGAHLRALQADGLRWQTPDYDEVLRLGASDLDGVVPQPRDVVCLATKLQDAQAVLDTVLRRWGEVPVVTWTNGISAHRWAAESFDSVVASVQFVPASASPGRVRLWGLPHFGAVHLGTVTGDSTGVRDALTEALRVAGFDAFAHPDVLPLVHAKWVRNLAGAAQALVVAEDAPAAAAAAIEEGRRVVAAAGLDVAPFDALLPTPMTLGTIDGESRGGGSTWQSLTSGRPLETPFLTGPLVELAERTGCPAPVNAALLAASAVAMAEGWRTPRLHMRNGVPAA